MEGALPASLLLLLSMILDSGALVAAPALHCFLQGPREDMNCTWSPERELIMDGTYTLHFRSMKYTPGTLVAKVPFLHGQHWVLVPRRNWTHSDQYHVWVEGPANDSNMSLGCWNMSTEDIEKWNLLELNVTLSDASSSEVIVTWKHYKQSRVQLRYRELGTKNWTWVNEEDIEPNCYEFTHLEAFTEYEVQILHILQNGKREWSLPAVFQTHAAAPVGLVDLWWYLDKGHPNLTVLWKALEPKAARDHNVTYTVSYRKGDAHGSSSGSIEASCCNTILPHNVEHIDILPANSQGKGQTTSLSLQHNGFPPPEEVKVQGTLGGLHVSWMPSRRLLPDMQEYVVQWSEATNRSATTIRWVRVAPTNHSVMLTDNFQSQVPYLISLYGLYPDGYAGPVSAVGYVEEGVPSVGPNITVQSVSQTKMLVLWDDIPLQQQRGIITHYTIYTRSNESQRSENVSVRKNSNLLDIHPSTRYELWMSASTSAGEGKTSYTTFMTPDADPLLVMLVPSVLFFIFLCVLVFCFCCRIWDIIHSILPEWCWQSIPDPVHSKITGQSLFKDMDVSQDAFLQCLYLSLDVPDHPLIIVEEVSVPEASLTGSTYGSLRDKRCGESQEPLCQVELTPCSTGLLDTPDVPVAWPLQPYSSSGYEKHFMPTAEDLRRCT